MRNEFDDILVHSWGTSPEQKRREKEYNAKYYKAHKYKWQDDETEAGYHKYKQSQYLGEIDKSYDRFAKNFKKNTGVDYDEFERTMASKPELMKSRQEIYDQVAYRGVRNKYRNNRTRAAEQHARDAAIRQDRSNWKYRQNLDDFASDEGVAAERTKREAQIGKQAQTRQDAYNKARSKQRQTREENETDRDRFKRRIRKAKRKISRRIQREINAYRKAKQEGRI